MFQIDSLLTIQSTAAIISFLGGVLVVLVVLFLMTTSHIEEDKTSVKHKVYKLRGRYFFVLVLCAVACLFITLRLLPYSKFQGEPEQTVSIVGIQWDWKMKSGAFDKSAEEFVKDTAAKKEITLPANKKIRFIVTSNDVNHDFAIYNTKGVLVAQTQAMPTYKNELEYEFSEAGDYHILCLEYCGLMHSIMIGTIHVN
ncbi:MAG: hypothetical protein IT214_09825 [Chitinophagaceae bacterium]|jgi:cytochrome c oxidase subunit 2|nr:hypothetical protein [Chitinophagaceae bacterium]OQY96490.1 MAG: hypothetical protein B6D37_01905 [Sphingobacteriales bacterium UTBCD1]